MSTRIDDHPVIQAAAWVHHDWNHCDNIAELWFSFLRISPSYDIVTQNGGAWPDDQKTTQNQSDRATVSSVYRDLGSVWEHPFTEWWSKRGNAKFTGETAELHIRNIATLGPEKNYADGLSSFLADTIAGVWDAPGSTPSLLVAVPVNMTPDEIAADLRSLLEGFSKEERRRPPSSAKYAPIDGKRFSQKALLKYLKLYWYWVTNQDLPLWRIGLEVGISAKYETEKLDMSRIADSKYADERRTLSILTSRALFRARMISENAARGVFPSYEPCAYALEFEDFVPAKLIAISEQYRERTR
jgi:hypothetical protein